MILPVTYQARQLPPEQRDPNQTCLCGEHINFSVALIVWTKPKERNRGWYAICSQDCFLTHCSEGEA